MTTYLCGFMGCGKSTIGKLAAKKIGCCFCDSDDLIVENQGMTIPKIFKEKGESYFRQVEADIIKSLCSKKIIVACGGGAMLNSETVKAVTEDGGYIIFLDVPFSECYERIKGDANRPIVVNSTRQQLEELYNQRREIYLQNSNIKIECIGSPIEAAEQVAANIKNI